MKGTLLPIVLKIVRCGGIVVSALALVFFVQPIAFAEIIEFQGARFPVDKIVSQSNGDVLIEVEGRSWLAPSDRVAASVAEEYLSNPELGRRMPWANYVEYLARGASSKELSSKVSKAIERILGSESLKDVEIELVAKRLSSGEGAPAMVSAIGVVAGGGQYRPSALCLASLQLGRSERMELGSRGILPQTMREACGVIAVDLARKAVLSGDFPAAEDLLRGALELYGAESNSGSALKVAADRISNFNLAFTGGDAFKLESAYNSLAADPLIQDSIATSLPDVARLFAKKRVEVGDGEAAIRVLAVMPSRRRTPEHHQLINLALDKVSSDRFGFLAESRMQEVLWEYCSKDPVIRARYIALLEESIERMSKGSDLSKGATLLASVRALRADPSPENDTLRFMLASAAADSGKWNEAGEFMRGVKTAIPARVKALLYCKRHPLVVSIPLLLFLALVGVRLRGVVKSRRSNLAKKSGGAPRGPRETPQAQSYSDFEASSEADRENVESLQSLSKSMREGRNQQEFEELLKVFGLGTNANLGEIKAAYRLAVKVCHPDRNREGDKELSDRFIELTKQYERLLEIVGERKDPASKLPN